MKNEKSAMDIAMKQLAAEFIDVYADKLCLLDQAIIDYTQLSSKAPSQHNAGVDDPHVASQEKIQALHNLHGKVSALSDEHISLSKYDASQPKQWQLFFKNAFSLMAEIQKQLGSFSIDFCKRVYDSRLDDVGSPYNPPSSKIFDIDRATQCEKIKFQEKQRGYYKKHLIELERLRRKVDELQQDDQESVTATSSSAAAPLSRKDGESLSLQVQDRQRLVDEYLKSAMFLLNIQDRTTTVATPGLAQLITEIMTVKAYIDAGNLSGKNSKSIAECVQSMLCRYSQHSASLASEIRNAVNAYLRKPDAFDAEELANEIISIVDKNREKQPLYVMNHQLLRVYDSISDRLYALLGTIQRSFTTNFQIISADVLKNLKKEPDIGELINLEAIIDDMKKVSRDINEQLKNPCSGKTHQSPAVVESDSLWGQFYNDVIREGVRHPRGEDIKRRSEFWGIRSDFEWNLQESACPASTRHASDGWISPIVGVVRSAGNALASGAAYLSSLIPFTGSAEVWKNSLVLTDSSVTTARTKPELVRFVRQATMNDTSVETDKDSNLFFFWLYIKMQYLRSHVYISDLKAHVKDKSVDIQFEYHSQVQYGSLLRLAFLNEGDVSVLAKGLGIDIECPNKKKFCHFLFDYSDIYCGRAAEGTLDAVIMRLRHGTHDAYPPEMIDVLRDLTKSSQILSDGSDLAEHTSLSEVITEIREIVRLSSDPASTKVESKENLAETDPVSHVLESLSGTTALVHSEQGGQPDSGRQFEQGIQPTVDKDTPPHNQTKSSSAARALVGVGVALLVIAAVCCAVIVAAAVPAITFVLPILVMNVLGISSAALTLGGSSGVIAGVCLLGCKKRTVEGTESQDSKNIDTP